MKCWEKKEGKEVRMSVSLIFKIAAVGILGLGLKPGVKAQRAGGAGVFDQSCRADSGPDLDCAVYLRSV